MPYVYILRCVTSELYVGITEDLNTRLARHNDGTACRFTATRRPVNLAYSEKSDSIRSAMARERQIKRWTRAKKEALVRSDPEALHLLSRRRVY
jgi:predicted GIY-YIG superfamily endonuclease